MGKKKKKADFVAELERSYERWEYLREHGGSDPFYADGTNMNLVRNHIMYYKGKMVEEYGADHDKYPLIFYKELPPVVKEDYIARAGEIRDGAVAALDCYLADPNFQYLLMNQGMLDKKEAEKISLYNVLGYVSGLARAIKDGDLIAMRRHAGRPEGYQESFAQCAAKMMELISKKKTEPERGKENIQISLFQFGMEIGQCR